MATQLLRQAVISIRRATDLNGNFEKVAFDIPFRQPFNNLGLDFQFTFTKAYWGFFTAAELKIFNINQEMTDAFFFDSKTYKKRPLVEIRAGYSNIKALNQTDIVKLKADLPAVFTGFPNFASDDKAVGERELLVTLNDITASKRTKRVSRSYKKGRLVLSVLQDLAIQADIKVDLTALENDDTFSAIELENDLYYLNRQVLTDIYFALSKSYGFRAFFDASSPPTLIFKRAGTQGIVGGFTVISEKTGMVEHPTSVNFVHWKVKTFFGRPRVLFPGDWIRVESEYMARLNKRTQASGRKIGGISKPVDKTVDGVIIVADYNWQGAEALIEYTLSVQGHPEDTNPILQI